MDLEAAAPETLSKVKALEAEIEEARKALQSAEDKIGEVREELQADDAAFGKAVEEFDQEVQEQRELLEREASESRQALASLADKIRTVHGQCEEEISEAREEVAALEDRIHALEPEVEDVFQQVTAAAEAVETALGQTLEEVKDAVGQAGSVMARASRDLKGLGDVVEKRVENLGAYVSEMCLPLLQSIAESWGKDLQGAVATTVAEGVESVQGNLPDVLVAVVDQCRTKHEEALDELAELSRRLEGVLQGLSGVVETGALEMLDASESEVQETQTTQAGLDELLSSLTRVKALLVSYAFMEM